MVYEVVEVDYDDYEFVFNIIKITMKDYIEEIRGWDEGLEHLFFKEEMSEEDNYVIKVDNERIAYLSLDKTADNIEIENLLILPKYQNKGIGTRIIKDLIRECKLKEKNLSLKAFKINEKANKFYTALGFNLVGEDKDYYKYEFLLKKSNE